MRVVLAVGIGSALGGLSRYGINVLFTRRASSFPWGTFLINVTGSFALGLLFALVSERLEGPAWLRSGLLAGFIGSYTTFSTWMLDSTRLGENGANGLAFANVAGSVAAGLAATYIGLRLGRELAPG